MKKLVTTLSLSLGIILVGCTQSPEKVATGFISDIAAAKIDSAYQVSKGLNNMSESDLKAAYGKLADEMKTKRQGLKSIETVKNDVNGETATIVLKVNTNDGKSQNENIRLSKSGSSWVIVEVK